MEVFELKGDNGSLIIRIDTVFGFPNETSFKGGYDCEVEVEINVASYFVKSNFSTSTGELFKFYEKLKTCQAILNGNVKFDSYESNLELTVKYKFGKVGIYGKYQENLAIENILEFNFDSDQSYLKKSVDQLERIINKYGGMKGVNA
jgi:hypothetical protein